MHHRWSRSIWLNSTANDGFVITLNLHIALSCLAFDTRGSLIHKKKEESHGMGRFEGMKPFFNWQSEEGLLDGEYDFNNASPNPNVFIRCRMIWFSDAKSSQGSIFKNPH